MTVAPAEDGTARAATARSTALVTQECQVGVIGPDSVLPLLAGTPAAEILPEIGLDERDLCVSRAGSLSPMRGTGLESLLRSLGVGTVVVAGVSVNVAILDLTLDCVKAGFEVIVPRDAVAGYPPEYAEAVIGNTLGLLARVETSADVLARWGAAG
jgi:nicotinamidase-related amidase